MPYCHAGNCNNRPENKDGKSFFQFPKPENELLRLETWLHSIGTGLTPITFEWNKNKKVWGDHFHKNCYESNEIAETLGYSPIRLKLKPGALPTIFSHKMYDVINMNGEVMPPKASAATLKRSKCTSNTEVSNNHSSFS